MNVREWMNKNTTLAMIGAVALLIIALGGFFVLNGHRIGDSGSRDVYFYDMNTGKIFVSSNAELPPIETDSGLHHNLPAGVRIRIFACGEYAEFSGLTLEEVQAEGGFPLWLERYTMDAKQMVGDESGGPVMIESGLLIRAIGGKNWVPRNSPAGVRVIQQVQELCPDGRLKLCEPGR
jgi:hypothetical protein